MIRPFVLALLILGFLASCKESYTPKPRGYFRISFPEKSYNPLLLEQPFGFDIPTYSYAIPNEGRLAQKHEVNIVVSKNKATIHLSYKQVNDNLSELTEECRSLAYKHTIKASSIDPRLFINAKNKVYGTIYKINGNAASPMQFYLTDSVKHFLRGSLYIKEVPNYDSLRPVIQFLEKDMVHMIETTKWR